MLFRETHALFCCWKMTFFREECPCHCEQPSAQAKPIYFYEWCMISYHFAFLLCEIAYYNKLPEDNDVIATKNLCFPDAILDETEATLLLSYFSIAASIFIIL